MNNRDLKADFELCKKYKDNIGPWFSENGFPTKHLVGAAAFLNQAREGWPHAIERAIEAEALARELVEALKHIERLAELARRRSRYPGAVMSYGAEIRLAVEGALERAKEVLGDEA